MNKREETAKNHQYHDKLENPFVLQNDMVFYYYFILWPSYVVPRGHFVNIQFTRYFPAGLRIRIRNVFLVSVSGSGIIGRIRIRPIKKLIF